ncbi:hypothetical protein DY000_02016127 [Brassica cretica]|uniref:Uncharacterized protein n=1 Tax=Brassica cretica TaxID=69181 RepID=A0ABQ7D7L5_BRACR|nr:hypothetical protein DY000_02016127 [Brassica cretica]
MEDDKAPMGRTLRKRKEKVAKHRKRGANEKEMEIFRKRVFRIPLEKPFGEAYFTQRLWMFYRETKETEEDVTRMFSEAREKMKNRTTLKKKSDHGKFAIPSTVEPSKEIFTFVDCSQRSSRGIDRDLESLLGNNRSNMQNANQRVCLALIDPHVHYNPIPVMKPQTSSRRIDDQGLIATCHFGAKYETKYSASIETHTATSIDSANQKLIDTHLEESINSSADDWENDYYNPTMAVHTAKTTGDTLHTEEYDEDYMEERAIEYHDLLSEEDVLLHHSYKNALSIDRGYKSSIDTHHHQTNRRRASTDAAYHTSIDTGVDHA